MQTMMRAWTWGHAKAKFKFLLVGLTLLATCGSVFAELIGQVEFSRGVGIAFQDGGNPRMLGIGLPLNEGDHLKTAETALAIIRLNDGTQMTLRPSTELWIQTFRYQKGSTDNALVIRLIEGGFRAITGRIPKDSPDAARVVTDLGMLHIRGTDFDARICGSDCRAETRNFPEKARVESVQASAKVVTVKGQVSALDKSGLRRHLVAGGAVFPSETVETGPATESVLAFRDDSRVTVGANTQFKVDQYVYKESEPAVGRSFLSLVRGSMRALTGAIGKERKENVGYKTPTATIGIRGTGLDIDCAGGESCSFFTWLGVIAITPNKQTTPTILSAGQGLSVSLTGSRPLTESTLQNLQRPDKAQVNVQQLFSVGTLSDGTPGLYVTVRDGNVELNTSTGVLFLSRGETGYAGLSSDLIRPSELPKFIEFDQTPMPNSINPLLTTVLNENKLRAAEVCN